MRNQAINLVLNAMVRTLPLCFVPLCGALFVSNAMRDQAINLVLNAMVRTLPLCIVLSCGALFVTNWYESIRIRRWGAGSGYTWSGLVLILFSGAVVYFVPSQVDRYEPPYADAWLECQHEQLRTPEGSLYCSAYPPKAILDADISSAERVSRRYTGVACAILAMGLAAYALTAGISYLISRSRTSCTAGQCIRELASLPVAYGLIHLSLRLLVIYPLPPL